MYFLWILKYTNTFALITGIDPADAKALFSDINLQGLSSANIGNYLTLYKGQTSIVRFLFVLNELKTFDLSFQITSTFPNDQFEIVNVFVANVGDNLPCTSNQATLASTIATT